MSSFIITEHEQDGHEFVSVKNADGVHLFCHINVAKAKLMLEQEHRVDVAATWSDTSKAPSLKIEIRRKEHAHE